jgi:hypothetical protein
MERDLDGHWPAWYGLARRPRGSWSRRRSTWTLTGGHTEADQGDDRTWPCPAAARRLIKATIELDLTTIELDRPCPAAAWTERNYDYIIIFLPWRRSNGRRWIHAKSDGYNLLSSRVNVRPRMVPPISKYKIGLFQINGRKWTNSGTRIICSHAMLFDAPR